MSVDSYPTVDDVRVAIKQRAHGKLNTWLAELELPSSVKEHRAWELLQEYGKTITADDVSQGNEQLTLLQQ